MKDRSNQTRKKERIEVSKEERNEEKGRRNLKEGRRDLRCYMFISVKYRK